MPVPPILAPAAAQDLLDNATILQFVQLVHPKDCMGLNIYIGVTSPCVFNNLFLIKLSQTILVTFFAGQSHMFKVSESFQEHI